MNKPHTHVNKHGILVECYHKSATELKRVGFWVGVTVSFPLEHILYEKVWPFTIIKGLLGL